MSCHLAFIPLTTPSTFNSSYIPSHLQLQQRTHRPRHSFPLPLDHRQVHIPVYPRIPSYLPNSPSTKALTLTSALASYPTSTTPDMLVDSFLVRTSPRWITVEPSNPAIPHQHVLYIDRNTLSIKLRTRADCAALAEPDTETTVHGLVGLVNTLHDSHLVVISKRQLVGDIMERSVYRVSKLEAIPVRGPKMLKKMAQDLKLSKADLAEETSLRSMLASAVSLHGFYYSHSLDLTRSAQKRANVVAAANNDDKAAAALPDFIKADMRFVWNRFAAQKLTDAGAVSWIVPLILGYVDVRTGMLNGKSVQLSLISRRSTDRPGLRFTARGADVHGNCSNFVETEQIVSHGETYSSYVQLRGSIPLLWKQEASLVYKPKPVLKDVDSGGKGGLCQTAFEKHFDSLLERYGPVTAVSLIDQQGGEGMLSEAYRNAFDMMGHPKLHFVPWEFHKQTKGMKYEKVESELLPSIDADIEAYSYFYSKDGTAGTITRRQRGIIRTNCIDSLDRTNVVQSVIAHRIMDASLKAMGVLDSNPETNSAKKFDAFEKDFKNTWADHADALSNFYAGSGALKTDYTRTGKRSKAGMVQDGIRALRRYVYQNFLDGKRQDGIDVLLGVVRMPGDETDTANGDMAHREYDLSSPSSKNLAAIASKAEPLLVKEKFCPHIAFFFLIGAAIGGVVIKAKLLKLAVTVLCSAGFFLFSKLTLKAGRKLVARPKLDGTH